MVIGCVSLALMFLAGVRKRHLAAVIGAGLLCF